MLNSTTRPRIGLVIDHPRRDLPMVAMTALALTRRGCAVSVVPLYQQGVDVPLLGLDAIVTTFARPANRGLVERFGTMGIDTYVLDTEGGVLAENGPNTPATLARTIRDEGWASLLAGYFFWGPVLRDAFLEADAMPADKLHLTGCPRFDPVSKRWRGMLDYPEKGFILVNTAFPLVNSRFTKGGEDRAAMIEAGWDENYVGQMIPESRAAMGRMIQLVDRLSTRFPERKFLVRPHPFENEHTYRLALSGRQNVTVNGEGSVLNVIANSAAVLQLNCSTAIEAIMLDTLPLSPDFISTPILRQHSTLPNMASRQVASEEELAAILADLPAAHAEFDFDQRYAQLVQPYFHLRDGFAADRIAEVLAKVPAKFAKPRIGESMRSSQARARPSQRAQAALANAIGSHRASQLRANLQSQRAAKSLTPTALAATISAAVNISGEPMPTVTRHRHPLTGAAMAAIEVSLQAGRNRE